MKISVIDKQGSGIALQLAKAIGATISGRFIYIPESKGSGYITGFSWGNDMSVMIRNYHLKEDILIERTNEFAEGQENVIFLLSGVFPSLIQSDEQLSTEQANILICRQGVAAVMTMPSNTLFGSVTIRVSRQYLNQLFEQLDHPVVASVLEAKDNFVYETTLSSQIIHTTSDMLHQSVPEALESRYYKLKCEELLCYIFAILMQREAVSTSVMHIEDIKAIYAVKTHLQSHLNEPPHIATLAREAGMSQPKLRKLFKQTFGKGVFDYYQSVRMQEAARLLREKRLSVSEVGYLLGFTNLSHFSRVFEEYIGVKPKRYSSEQ
ncbi:helix-turn-helix transcriptional regulator [Xanthocytophaga flava]|uniref:helix-turn-helix transcriptional regulator n=1 Tax=Xanthocytophaga flava TaxID=3048013 RepID=UPI0028D85A4D|nr:AraC family transcriptional regulator [Xanthocytophaga flavus]MDJ1469027.1 AraC family transcriptional regulator [Xanthocytophaga flavus]